MVSVSTRPLLVVQALLVSASSLFAGSEPPGESQRRTVTRSAAQEAEDDMKSYGVPNYPGLEYVCESVADDFEHGIAIYEKTLASADEPGQVIEFYRKALGEAGLHEAGAETFWRIPPEDPRKVFIVRPVLEHPGNPFGCSLPLRAKTLVIASSRSG